MYLQETTIHVGENYIINETPVYEAFTDDIGALFKSCQKDFGRCTGKVYVETGGGKGHAVGWIFMKREQYTDCKDTFLMETHITLHDKEPEHSVMQHYHTMGNAPHSFFN